MIDDAFIASKVLRMISKVLSQIVFIWTLAMVPVSGFFLGTSWLIHTRWFVPNIWFALFFCVSAAMQIALRLKIARERGAK